MSGGGRSPPPRRATIARTPVARNRKGCVKPACEPSRSGRSEMQIGQVPVALVEVEAVADEELVRNREADVLHRQVVDQAPVGPVEERDRVERGRLAEAERLADVVERQP